MKKVSVKPSTKRETNKFAGLKAPKKGPATPKKAEKKAEWWRRPTEDSEQVKPA